MPAGRTPTHTSLAISRGRERSRRLLVTPRSGGLRTRQAYGSAALGRQRRSRQQHDEYDAQDKTHDAPPFLFASTREGGVPDALRARQFQQSWSRRFTPVGTASRPLVEPAPQCASDMFRQRQRPKAGRSINVSMGGSTPKPVACSEASSTARKCPAKVPAPAGVSRHRKRERFDRQPAARRAKQAVLQCYR